MSRFEVIRLRLGMAIVCTRLPFIIRRISIVSSVKAITYGKAQAAVNRQMLLVRERAFINIVNVICSESGIFNWRTYGCRHRIPIEVELGRRSVLFRQFLKVTRIWGTELVKYRHIHAASSFILNSEHQKLRYRSLTHVDCHVKVDVLSGIKLLKKRFVLLVK